MHIIPIAESSMIGIPEALILAFLGLLMLVALALFIYSIVAKKYWLTILMLLLPAGLIIVLVVLITSYRMSTANPTRDRLTSEVIPAEVSDVRLPDEPWSETLPPTADIYPSIALCGRPLAFQIAEAIKPTATTYDGITAIPFAVTFVKEKRPGDHTHWKPPVDFVANFRDEFVKRFPGSTVEDPVKMAELEPDSKDPQPLEIKLSFEPPENKTTDQQNDGSISARWTSSDNTRAVASIDFADKPWVIDPDKYLANNKIKRMVVGFSQRLARTPAEATTLALKNAARHGPVTPNQIVERFTQKLSFPYGDLWQESVLVDHGVTPSFANAAAFRAQIEHAESGSKGFFPLNGLILTTIGLIAIGWISNLLTQGYYRQNINYTVVTGIAVIVGLLALVLLTA